MKRYLLIPLLLLGGLVLLAVPGFGLRPTLPPQSDGSAPAVGEVLAAPLARVTVNTPPGRILFARDHNLWMWERGSARQLTEGGTWAQPSWSPDGQRIAYVYLGPHFSDIYLMDARGGNFVRLTRSQASILEDNDWAFHPIWSPDGRRLAYTTDAASYNPVLWLMDADGSNKRMLFSVSGGFASAVDGISWDPEGRRIVAAGFDAQVSQIYVVDVASRTSQQLTDVPDGAFDPAWSPDGRWIAFVARDGRRTVLTVMSEDGTASRPITEQNLVSSPTWSPDGRQLAFLSAEGGAFDIWLMDVASDSSGVSFTNPRPLTRNLGVDARSGLSWGR